MQPFSPLACQPACTEFKCKPFPLKILSGAPPAHILLSSPCAALRTNTVDKGTKENVPGNYLLVCCDTGSEKLTELLCKNNFRFSFQYACQRGDHPSVLRLHRTWYDGVLFCGSGVQFNATCTVNNSEVCGLRLTSYFCCGWYSALLDSRHLITRLSRTSEILSFTWVLLNYGGYIALSLAESSCSPACGVWIQAAAQLRNSRHPLCQDVLAPWFRQPLAPILPLHPSGLWDFASPRKVCPWVRGQAVRNCPHHWRAWEGQAPQLCNGISQDGWAAAVLA